MSDGHKIEITESNILDLVTKDIQFAELLENAPKFNPFEVLGLKNYEIRHSNMLAWLFDPNETHGLGDIIARRFALSACNRNQEKERFCKVDVALISRNGMSDLQVHRERAHIDLLLVSDANNLIILVENKWDASESMGQLRRYLNYLDDEYKQFDSMPIFLTIDGREPNDEGDQVQYGTYSYVEICEILESVLMNNDVSVSDEIVGFINYYINVLKEKIGVDDENKKLNKLCREIYSKHRHVIDKIYEAGNDASIAFREAMEIFCEYGELEGASTVMMPRVLSFVPKQLCLEEAEIVKGWPQGNYAVACWFEYNGDEQNPKIKFIVEVGPFEKRRDFIQSLMSNGLQPARKEFNDTYTRMGVSETLSVDSFFDTSKVAELMLEMYRKRGDDIAVIKEVMKNFCWD